MLQFFLYDICKADSVDKRAWLPPFCSFLIMFSKAFYLWFVKFQNIVVKKDKKIVFF